MTLRYDAGEVITAMVTPFNDKGRLIFRRPKNLPNIL